MGIYVLAALTTRPICLKAVQKLLSAVSFDLNKHVPVMSKRGQRHVCKHVGKLRHVVSLVASLPGDRGYVHYIGFLQLLPPDVRDDFHPLDHLQLKNVVGGAGWATGLFTGAFCQFR